MNLIQVGNPVVQRPVGAILCALHATGVVVRQFRGHVPYVGEMEKVRPGVFISNQSGSTDRYSMVNFIKKGTFIVPEGTEVSDHELASAGRW